MSAFDSKNRSKLFMLYVAFSILYDKIERHEVFVVHDGNAFAGWRLDIARGLYILRTGKIIAKTAAGGWALEEGLCHDADVLRKAVQIRKEPLRYSKEDKSIDNAVIQRFTDVLEKELYGGEKYVC